MAKGKRVTRDLRKNLPFLIMVLPVTLYLIIFKYLPMFGVIIAFKDYRITPFGFIVNLFKSEWIGFDNFKFLFTTTDAFVITRNTVGYNLVFIVLGLILSVALAILLSEMRSQKLRKVFQTGMFLPYFLSWVVVSYLVVNFLDLDHGVINKIIVAFGGEGINWYTKAAAWPFILLFISQWKNLGYSSVVYLAAIAGIDHSYYEAAMIDGASKLQQIKYITLPMLKPLMIILTILAIGRIFYADFGLFYQVPQESGALFPVTNVIDTYVYRALMVIGDIGMSSAAGLYQSFVGFILVLTTNKIVRKSNEDYALF